MEDIFEIPTPLKSPMADGTLFVEDEWARKGVLKNVHAIDQMGAEVRDIKQIIDLLKKEKSNEWKVQPVQPTHPSNAIDIPLSIRTAFEKLEEDFHDYSNRILWCNELKDHLSKFEESLEEYDAKYLSWFVSALKDVFCYNYAEQITDEQLGLIKKGFEIFQEKKEDCDKESFLEYHMLLVESGLSLLPTSKKAIDKFGE